MRRKEKEANNGNKEKLFYAPSFSVTENFIHFKYYLGIILGDHGSQTSSKFQNGRNWNKNINILINDHTFVYLY